MLMPKPKPLCVVPGELAFVAFVALVAERDMGVPAEPRSACWAKALGAGGKGDLCVLEA